jgi:hypothetical protein
MMTAERTVEDVVNGLTEKQKVALNLLLGTALSQDGLHDLTDEQQNVVLFLVQEAIKEQQAIKRRRKILYT